MCGIIAVVRRPSLRQPPGSAEVSDRLEAASQLLAGVLSSKSVAVAPVADAVTAVADADRLLRGVPGVRALLEMTLEFRDLASKPVNQIGRGDAKTGNLE